MVRRMSVLISGLLIGLCLLTPTQEAAAQNNFNFSGIGPSGGQVALAIAGAAVIVGVGVYLIARTPRTTGCIVKAGTGYGLQGTDTGDHLYLLQGDTSALKTGERVKLVGRRRKDKMGNRFIRLVRVARDYGACSTVNLSYAPVGSPADPGD